MALRWLDPLFVNDGGAAIAVGVEVEAGPRWFIRLRDEVFPLGQPGFAVEPDWIPLLPLLQPGYGGSWEDAHRLVAARLVAAGIDAALVDTFPFELVVLAADASGSSFWLDHAESWRPHVRDRYAVAGFRAQFARLYNRRPGSLALPPGQAERTNVFKALWRSLGADGRTPSWSSGLIDAAVRWSLGEDLIGVRRLWVALLAVLRDVEPNVLHLNLFDQLWISARGAGLHRDLAARPPAELRGPLTVAQALLVLRFLPLEGELGNRIRRTFDGVVLADVVDGRRYSSRLSLADLLS